MTGKLEVCNWIEQNGKRMTHLIESDLNHVLAHTQSLKNDLRGARLFLTGGTGFFGRWLLESFLWMNRHFEWNATVMVLIRPGKDFHFPWPAIEENTAIEIHRGDVRDFKFPKGSFTHVIHAAASGSPGLDGLSAEETLDTVVGGTRHVLDFAKEKRAERVLFTSSGAVYGKQPPGLDKIPENFAGKPDESDPRLAYSEGKRLAEILCLSYAEAYAMEITIARCFGFMGPFIPLDRGFALGNFVRNCIQNEPIVIQGDGTNHRSYLYAADLAIWLWTILLKGKSAHPYNVGCEESHSVFEIAQEVRGAFQKTELPVSILRTADPTRPIDHYTPDTLRARVELGLEAWISFREGIRRTVGFYQKSFK